MAISLDQLLNIIKTFSLVGGGLWTVWVFHATQKQRRAEIGAQTDVAKLTKSKLEIERERRKRLREQPALGITLKVTDAADPSDPTRRVLCVIAKLRNYGDQNLDLECGESALTVGRVVEDEHHRQLIVDIRRLPSWYLPPNNDVAEMMPSPRVFRIGQVRRIPFVIGIPGQGVYFVQFVATYQKRLFDGERVPHDQKKAIDAIEQTVYVVGEEPSKSRAASSPASNSRRRGS